MITCSIFRGGQGRFITVGDYTTHRRLDAARAPQHLRLPTGRGRREHRRRLPAQLPRAPRRRAHASPTARWPPIPIRYLGRAIERYSLFGEVQAPLLPARNGSRAGCAVSIRTSRCATSRPDSSAEANVAPTFALKARLAGGLAFRGSVSTSSRYPTPQLSRVTPGGPEFNRPTTAGIDFRQRLRSGAETDLRRCRSRISSTPISGPRTLSRRPRACVWRGGGEHRFRVGTRLRRDAQGQRTRHPRRADDPQPRTPFSRSRVSPDGSRRGRRRRHGEISRDAARSIPRGAARTIGTPRSTTRGPSFSAEPSRPMVGCIYYTRYDHLLMRPASPSIDELSQPRRSPPTNLLRYRAKFGAELVGERRGASGLDGHYFHSRVLPRFAMGRNRGAIASAPTGSSTCLRAGFALRPLRAGCPTA